MKVRVFTKNLAVVALICLFVASASAQPRRERRSAEERAKNQTEQLDKSLTLTADQKTKVEAVNLELAKKADKLMESSDRNSEKFREQLQEQETTRDAKYKEILTAEQYAKYTKAKEERRRDFASRGRGTRGERGNRNAPAPTPPAKEKK
ncbi:MAG: hypothetical protein LBC98_09680 [Prevotellaceae bacterium]|jgi:Spy/CpxP family protein refolding chaperone|nr:hypothetical protein [Prevotellaceae bacterium]